MSRNNKRYYIIGDVHGHYDKLLRLVKKLPENAKLVFTGDLIDRGPDSARVISFVRDNGHLCVRGNHEEFMIEQRPEPGWEWSRTHAYKMWIENGGQATLNSYGLYEYESLRYEGSTSELLKPFFDDIEWLDTLPYYIKLKDCTVDGRKVIVTHASVSRVWKDRLSNRMSFNSKITTNREKPSDIEGIFNVIGHTPFEEPQIFDFAARIDTGAYLYGTLSALEVPTLKTITVQ